MRGWSRATLYLAVGALVAGFVLIVLGWNGAASTACVDCQLPFLISGGLGGLALVVVGGTLALVHEIRRVGAALTRSLDEALRARPGMSTSRSSAPPEAGEALVVAGGTVHRPDCRIIEGEPDLPATTPAAATRAGLEPCRVCQPRPAG